jgi:hypothetical protein
MRDFFNIPSTCSDCGSRSLFSTPGTCVAQKYLKGLTLFARVLANKKALFHSGFVAVQERRIKTYKQSVFVQAQAT